MTQSEHRKFSQAEIIETLTGNGVALDDYFLLDDIPVFFNALGQRMGLVIEDDALADACTQFLRDRGARKPGTGS